MTVLLEVLYIDGCPQHEPFLDDLRALLAEHHVEAELRLTRIDGDVAAQAHRFLGSPSLRIDGVDVDASAATRSGFGVQCRLYATPAGPRPTPPTDWVVAGLRRAGVDLVSRRPAMRWPARRTRVGHD